MSVRDALLPQMTALKPSSWQENAVFDQQVRPRPRGCVLAH
ncbi:hypothetical protein HMPREF9057_00245 [Actinomyces sp. oral taxon 171 str. F0337]|nr:hypothetical protein HMPREF9057_00245 [Actinomyces sp. oral taxon 171 str. F0337]